MEAVLRLGKKKLYTIGGSSRYIVIPKVVVEHWKQEIGEEPEFVELIFVNGALKIFPSRKEDHS
jgi:hypothetical protein